jgi:hypothetical protein
MAAYPDLPQIVGSQKLDDDGTVLDFAESGKPRLRQYYTQVRTRFNIIHDVDGPDKDTIVSHYDGDKTNVFSFTFKGDSVTYCAVHGRATNYTRRRYRPVEGGYNSGRGVSYDYANQPQRHQRPW